MEYLQIRTDTLEAIEQLSAPERGRLFTALLKYGRTGEAPELPGNEKYVFPMLKIQTDAAKKAAAEK